MKPCLSILFPFSIFNDDCEEGDADADADASGDSGDASGDSGDAVDNNKLGGDSVGVFMLEAVLIKNMY
jgi:hypothetical protein